MELPNTKNLLAWLDETQENRQFNLQDMKNLTDIIIMEVMAQEEKEIEYKGFDGLPSSVVQMLVKKMESNESSNPIYDKIKQFKSSFIKQEEDK